MATLCPAFSMLTAMPGLCGYRCCRYTQSYVAPVHPFYGAPATAVAAAAPAGTTPPAARFDTELALAAMRRSSLLSATMLRTVRGVVGGTCWAAAWWSL